jgi:hypothetical protein
MLTPFWRKIMQVTFNIEDGTPAVVRAEAGESLLDIAKRAGSSVHADTPRQV